MMIQKLTQDVREERFELFFKILKGDATKEDRKKYEELNKKYIGQLREEELFRKLVD